MLHSNFLGRSFARASILAFSLLSPGVVMGQTASDGAAARALFSEGRKLAEAGKHEAACPKFEESLRLKPGTGTLFNLADCWEQVGRTASAWGAFLEVAAAAKSSGQQDRENIARSRAASLEPKLAKLVIEIDAPESNLRVMHNGREVGQGALGTPVPVDPGSHRIEASAPNKETWSSTIEIKARQVSRIQIPQLLDAAQPTEPEGALNTSKEETTPALVGSSSKAITDERSGFGFQRGVGLGLAGVGLAGLTVGTVFVFRYNAANEDAKKLCPTNTCPADDIRQHGELLEEARGHRTMSVVGFGVGGAALVAGAVVYLTAPGQKSAATTGARLRVEPLTSGDANGLSLSGVW